jgi:gliding motility-associated-like protein
MKKIILISLVLLLVIPCQAKHIIGGEMIYEYAGKGTTPNTSKYIITLKLFRDQNAPPDAAAMPQNVFIGVFNNDDGQQFKGPNPWFDVPKQSELPVTVNPFPPCIENAPSLSYHTGLYIFTVDLPDNKTGYTATYQTCCRISPLSNANTFGGTGTGSTYTCTIPPIHDNSPEFATSIDAICGGKPFSLKFNATDADNDSLSYALADAYNGGSFINSGNANPAPPPYSSVPYINPYSADAPLGNEATIDSKTGIISGIAPDVGRYVVGVAVFSYRNGILINEHRKDFIVNVTNCDFAGAKLNPKPVSCDGFNVSFSNDDFSPLNKTFYWSFGNPSTGTADTSTSASPIHVYSDTGVFVYKLVVNRGQNCSDSATQIVKVYPGFFPDFKIDGKCKNSPIQFIDHSSTNYGVVNSWSWNFGDPVATNDTSHLTNPSYTYANGGNYPVELSITSSKGCNKSFKDTITILEKPVFSITHDTLICNIDALQLNASGQGTVSWSPNYNISDPVSVAPVVTPKVTTTYYATLFESPGCSATDSVKVNVVNAVSLSVGNDTTICLSDTIQLNTISNALHYAWTPAASLSSDTAKSPFATPLVDTKYHLVGSIGKCSTARDLTVKVAPYPQANAGNDTTICATQSLQLIASGGSIYLWSPSNFLNNPAIPNPVTTPPQTIRYVVKVNDVLGCPKAVYDTIIINVDKPVADAGPRDTIIVVNQPLQLNGTGAAESFVWTPATGLNNAQIPNPVALLSENQQYVLKITSNAGCISTDTIDIVVYKVKPGIFVPNSFTPNGDGLNDIFRPILIGMKSLHYFKIFNRAGQLIFSTKVQNQGWDGTYKGAPQDASLFVWIVEGEDYLGKTVFEKGSVTLVR